MIGVERLAMQKHLQGAFFVLGGGYKLHSFGDLTSIIQTTHDAALSSAVKAINRMQTMRNWLIGYYIVEYEQNGKDRAEYGAKLLPLLSSDGRELSSRN